jgi:hypothetical protein
MTDTFLGFTCLAVVAISLVLWFRALGRLAIPENRSIYVATWSLAAILGVAAFLGEPGWLGGVPAGIGTFLSVFFLFTVAVSRQKVGDESIQVGDTIPHFTATDEKGEIFDSHNLAGQPVLIKFFRGHW